MPKSKNRRKPEPKVYENVLRRRDLDHLMDYRKDFTFLFSGVEDRNYFKYAYGMGVRDFLMSWFTIKIRGLDAFDDYQFKKGDTKFFIDSGAFTFLKEEQYQHWGKEDWEAEIENYLLWVRAHSSSISAIANFDLEDLVGVDTVRMWNRKYFEPFMVETDIPVCFIWHPVDGEEGWEYYCKRYPYVGFSGAVANVNTLLEEAQRKIAVAKRYNTLVHGMGITKTTLLPELPLYTSDSVTFKVGTMYGNHVVWMGDYIRQCPDEEWDEYVVPTLAKYPHKFNMKNLREFAQKESTELGVYSCQLAQEYIRKKLMPHTYWKMPRVKRNDVYDESLYPPLAWLEGYDDYPNYRQYAERLNINPDDQRDTVIDNILYAALFTHWDNHTYRFLREKLTYGVLQVLHERYVNVVRNSREEQEEDLVQFFTDVVEGETDKLLLAGTVFDRIPKEREFQITDDEGDSLREASNEEVQLRLRSALQIYGEDTIDYEKVDEETYRQAGLMREMNSNHGAKKIMIKTRKAKNVYNKLMPKMVCNNCSLGSMQCPEFREGAVCAYNSMFSKFDTRNPEDIKDALYSITNLNIARVQRAAMGEVLKGGAIRAETSAVIQQTTSLISAITKLEEAQIQASRTRNADGSVTETVGVAGGRSLLASMIAQTMGKSDPEPIEVEGVVVEE